MIVREHYPAWADLDRDLRETHITDIQDALKIPWLIEKGPVTVEDDRYVMREGWVVATIRPDEQEAKMAALKKFLNP